MHDTNDLPEPALIVGGEDELPEGCACPVCGERRYDWLVWRPDDSGVDCQTCGHFYDPNS
jgi:rubredoxin